MATNTVVTSTFDMDWTPIGAAPGLFTKMLRVRPGGGRTALQRLDLREGYQTPERAHFHNVYEEILCVKGEMTFDHKTWLKPFGYVYHPPRTVHGFESGVKEEAWFLSRVGATLDFNYIDEPLKKNAYAVGKSPKTRPYACTAAPLDEAGERSGPAVAVTEVVLSRDTTSGEGSSLVRLGPGATYLVTRDPGMDLEVFVLEGSADAGGATWTTGCFVYAPDWETSGAPVVAGADGADLYLTYVPKESGE